MSDKPSYLGLLNAISIAESRAHEYLNAWIAVTPSDDVRAVLCTVSAREGEHGMAFAKRINELGYNVRVKDDDTDARAKAVARAGADCSDLEKMEIFGLGRLDTGSKPDIFDDFFKDHSIDIRTGELLGRYIAEERDSARLLRSCYEQLKAARDDGDASTGDETRLDVLEAKVDAVARNVEQLCEIVSAQAGSTNGNGTAKKPARAKA
jgi:hypothetical protein